jgi:hypothetical protein
VRFLGRRSATKCDQLYSDFCFALLCLRVGLRPNPRNTESDRHLQQQDDPVRLLYQRSAFAHGYVHGYEEGFHESNFDYQLNRDPKDPREFKQYRKGNLEYSSAFGSKNSYVGGYRIGFVEGYRDGIHGAPFRAVRELRRIAAGINSSSDRVTFDSAFAKGYQSAQKSEPRSGQEPACPGISLAYCEGFARGYQLGTADVLANGADRIQTARVRQRH